MKLVIAVYSEKQPYWSFPEDRVGELRREFPELNIVYVKSQEALLKEIIDADAIHTSKITREALAAARKLRWIHAPSAGVEQILIPEISTRDLVITNSRGISATPVADQVLGYMLVFTRRLIDAALYQKEKQWGVTTIWNSEPPLDILCGKTLGIVGFGAIGQEVAKRAKPFGMNIVATRRNLSKEAKHVDRLLPPDKLSELLSGSDFVLLSIPLTAIRGKIIGASELRLMKKTAYLINVSRGDVLDEDALIDALRNEQIRGAALDVFRTEPLPPESPLWQLPNVMITPHYGGLHKRVWDHIVDLLKENLRDFICGQELKNVVDKRTGY